MSDAFYKTVIGVGIAAILALIFLAGYRVGKQGRSETITEHTDTLTIRDTIVQYKPIPVAKREVERVFIAGDTVIRHDTTYVVLTREEKIYESKDYRAVVSGIRPSLDTIQIYRQRTFVNSTRIVTQKQWRKFTYGVQLGIGAQYGIINRKLDVGPYFGVGIGYNF